MSTNGPDVNPYETPMKPGYEMGGPAPPSGAVTAVAIVNFVVGAMNLMCGGALAFGGGLLASVIGTAAREDPNISPEEAAAAAGVVGGVVVAIGVIIIIFSLPMFIAGYGVTKRVQWARILTIVLGVISCLFALVDLVQMNLCGLVLHAGYGVFVLVVLFNAKYAAEFD